ncbi:hypothetical protein R1sor_013599 [Riccia sorocarpa]|uniref:Reverse transcriptase zinc-binding domain-containing protein n=1 Tax=Riccia sorocarpa TaxID=122646 RepID=A0ABD3HAL4_9MARC
MKALRKEELTGQLRGLQLPSLKSVLYKLFADDTSVFISASAKDFQQARKTIQKFEQASGAKLNVQKSLVLALGNSRNSSWLADLGCEVADNRGGFKFLGVWSGKGIIQAEIAEKITASIDGRLRSWVKRYLTFASRLLLIKHVLTAIPSHHLMSVGLDKKGLAMVNRSIRQFLWGTAESARAKIPLIAWDKLHLPKNLGGLGWTSLKLRMESHLAFNALRLLSSDHQNSNWMRLASAILMKHHSNGLKANWSAPNCCCSQRDEDSVCTNPRKDPPDEHGEWRQAEGELMKRSWFPEEPDNLAMEETWRHIWRKRPVSNSIDNIAGWKWKHIETCTNFKEVSRRELRIILQKEGKSPLFSTVLPEASWQKIWESATSFRTRITLWRFLQKGFFSNSKALRMRKGDGLCSWCGTQVEHRKHLFWNCRSLP